MLEKVLAAFAAADEAFAASKKVEWKAVGYKISPQGEVLVVACPYGFADNDEEFVTGVFLQ